MSLVAIFFFNNWKEELQAHPFKKLLFSCSSATCQHILNCQESNSNSTNDEQVGYAHYVGPFPYHHPYIVWSNITVGMFINEGQCWYEETYLLYFYVGTNVWLIINLSYLCWCTKCSKILHPVNQYLITTIPRTMQKWVLKFYNVTGVRSKYNIYLKKIQDNSPNDFVQI